MGPPPAPPRGPPKVTRTSGTLQGFHMAAAFYPGQGRTAGTVHGGDRSTAPLTGARSNSELTGLESETQNPKDQSRDLSFRELYACECPIRLRSKP